jgi:hypothetical protein
MNSDDDDLELNPQTLAALQEFLKEKNEHNERFQQLKDETDIDFLRDFKEDWQKSQFWYQKETSDSLAQIVLNGLGEQVDAKVALLCCPSAYFSLRQAKRSSTSLILLEHDERFERISDFVWYDFNRPLDLKLGNTKYDYICIDPPYLSPECFELIWQTVDFISHPSTKILVCTGKVMTDWLEQKGLKLTAFEIKHQNGLSNDYGCYTNYDLQLSSLAH